MRTFDENTTVADILQIDPALISVFDRWGLHLVPSTAVAMNAPLGRAARWHAIHEPEKLIAELNAQRGGQARTDDDAA